MPGFHPHTDCIFLLKIGLKIGASSAEFGAPVPGWSWQSAPPVREPEYVGCVVPPAPKAAPPSAPSCVYFTQPASAPPVHSFTPSVEARAKSKQQDPGLWEVARWVAWQPAWAKCVSAAGQRGGLESERSHSTIRFPMLVFC